MKHKTIREELYETVRKAKEVGLFDCLLGISVFAQTMDWLRSLPVGLNMMYCNLRI